MSNDASVLKIVAYDPDWNKELWDDYYVYDSDIDDLLSGDSLTARANRTALAQELGLNKIPWADAERYDILTEAIDGGPSPDEAVITEEAEEEEEDEEREGRPPKVEVALEEPYSYPVEVLNVNGYYLVKIDFYHDLKKRLDRYPILDDGVYSELESEDVKEYWEDTGFDEALDSLADVLGVSKHDLQDLFETFPQAKELLYDVVRDNTDVEHDDQSAYLAWSTANFKQIANDFIVAVQQASYNNPDETTRERAREFIRRLLRLVVKGEKPTSVFELDGVKSNPIISKTFFV